MCMHCCVMGLTLSAMFGDFCRAPNYFEFWILTTFPLPRQDMLTLPPAVSSDDGKDDAWASVETSEVTIIAFCMQWLSISRWCWPKHWDFLSPGIKEEKGNSSRSVHCLLCLSMGSTMPSLSVLLVNTVVLPDSKSLFRTAPWKSWIPGNLDFHTYLASCLGEQ